MSNSGFAIQLLKESKLQNHLLKKLNIYKEGKKIKRVLKYSKLVEKVIKFSQNVSLKPFFILEVLISQLKNLKIQLVQSQKKVVFLNLILCYPLLDTPKEEKCEQHQKQLVYFYNQNQLDFRQIRYWLFFYKVILYLAFEALIILVTQHQVNLTSNKGYILDEQMRSIQQFFISPLLDQTKLLTHANFYQYIIQPIAYFGLRTVGELFQFLISYKSLLKSLLYNCSFVTKRLRFNFIPQSQIFLQGSNRNQQQNQTYLNLQFKKKERKYCNKYLNICFKNYSKLKRKSDYKIGSIWDCFKCKNNKNQQNNLKFKNIQLEFKYQLNELLFN